MAWAVVNYAVVLLVVGIVEGTKLPSDLQVDLEALSRVNECTNYSELSSSDRSLDYTNDTIDKCDAELTPGWYRFTKPAGSRMASRCVPYHHCSALHPGWLYGSHPEEHEGIVRRQVCFQSDEACCYAKMKVLVRNCGDFFVYLLFDIPCPFRYCGSHRPDPLRPLPSEQTTTELPPFPPSITNGLSTSAAPTTLPTFPPALKSHRTPDECHDYISLTSTDRSVAYYNPFYAKGDYDLQAAWYRFMGKAGTMMPDSCVPVFHCGTHAPGWLLGGHPNDAFNHAVQRTTCFHWNDDCCYFKQNISVRQCDGYFVYKLEQNSIKYLRYCGNGISKR